ncbi:MAG: hypothetical protein H6R14_2143 [Proteobacteria bacterium]|nr:hypothetical protein [Pseudomonadota bacterium]
MMDVLNALAIKILNHLIQAESWAQHRLSSHAGAVVKIESGPFTFNLGIDEQGMFRSVDDGAPCDVTVTLPPDLPARLLLDRSSLFSSVKLGGAADVAESFAFVLRNLKWDVEADLAQIFGDIVAKRSTRIGKAFALSLHDALGKGVENLSEYAVEESRILAAKREVGNFSASVNQLRDDTARLEKRIARL